MWDPSWLLKFQEGALPAKQLIKRIEDVLKIAI
ncbi:unnamed protein product [Spirodela intermedia]|uniref:Uncharacterized protein n=2 Tax=Spirodela intermedia TaxID=51605 RepID=A0A7I8KGU1_SPIIN|nr:unnamed protein product [Spirodela intermedia]CAA6660550.1 unnamed protein product [Spirodela intermedia]CAA7396901.1 unnamed protein product [Spirodela intermedia]